MTLLVPLAVKPPKMARVAHQLKAGRPKYIRRFITAVIAWENAGELCAEGDNAFPLPATQKAVDELISGATIINASCTNETRG